MRVDVEEIRGPLLAMKSIHGVPDAEIMFCRPGIPLVKTEDFFYLRSVEAALYGPLPSCVLLATERKANLPDLRVFGDHLQY